MRKPVILTAISFAVFLFMVGACGQPEDHTAALQLQIDSLEHRLHNSYAPGLGEFMSGIQVHHAKLWFAGKAGNWRLADFEIGEIQEAVDDINKYCTDRPEVSSLPMLQPALDSVSHAVTRADAAAFSRTFMVLTNTCNNCHRATRHEFNVIQVPATPPFSNQLFAKPEPAK
ncbi:MAG TPA: hypothetical protein VHE54_00185 [Puia sp.]|nr:hypothetical protein [Puia sp.]